MYTYRIMCILYNILYKDIYTRVSKIVKVPFRFCGRYPNVTHPSWHSACRMSTPRRRRRRVRWDSVPINTSRPAKSSGVLQAAVGGEWWAVTGLAVVTLRVRNSWPTTVVRPSRPRRSAKLRTGLHARAIKPNNY